MITEFNLNSDISSSFAVIVANEIIRMRQRISSMPSEINGLKQLMKSLDRLEEELILLGFELPDLLNKPYHEGMTMKISIIPSENLKTGERLITKIIKPQVNYKGKLIQIAEVEVSISK